LKTVDEQAKTEVESKAQEGDEALAAKVEEEAKGEV
jgi:hypothetical protein